MNKMKPVKDIVASENENKGFSLAQIKQFVQEVQLESKKIVWPTRKITMGLTTVVIIFSSVASLYLGMVDFVLGKIISTLIN